MRVGDLFEWGAGGLAIAAGVTATHLVWVGLAIGAVFLAYEAQCYATHKLKLPKFRKPKIGKALAAKGRK